MKYSELVGDTRVDPLQTVKQITSLFDAEDKFVVVGMRQARITTGQNVFSQTVVAKEFVEQLSGPGAVDLLEGLSTGPDGANLDLYFSVATVDGDVPLNRRGEIDAIKNVKCAYVDLDVKRGSFESQEDAMAYLRKLPQPTLITLSGSGGVHGFWRFTEPLDADSAAEVQRSWYALLTERAEPIFIDRLIDASRVMRLAGGVRYPKAGESRLPAVSTVHWRNRNNRYDPAKLLEWSAAAAERAEEKIKATRTREKQQRTAAPVCIEGDGDWASILRIASIEETLNALLTWDEILCPSGWTFLRTDRVGRREWARPGSGSKSASTDYPGSPDILSLHSWSPDTGLSDLKEANIPLSKSRLAQRFLFADDYQKMVDWVLAQ